MTIDERVNNVLDRLQACSKQSHRWFDLYDELDKLTSTNRAMLSLSDATLARIEKGQWG